MKIVINKIYDGISFAINWTFISSLYFGNALVLPVIILFVITIGPVISFIISIGAKIAGSNSASTLSVISDILGIISIIISYILVVQKGYTFHAKFTTFIEEIKNEIKTVMPIYNGLGIDLESKNSLSLVSNKLALLYIDLFEKYSDINAFGYSYYKDLNMFISKIFELSFTKRKFLDFIIFNNKFEHYSKFITEEKDNGKYLVSGTDYNKTILLLCDYYKKNRNNEIYDLPSIEISNLQLSKKEFKELYDELFFPEKTSFYKSLTTNFDEQLSNSILKYAIKESYTVLSYDTKSKKINGPVLILKNEENFDKFLESINKEAKEILKNKNQLSDEEIEKYSIKKEKSLTDYSKVPFSYALKKDPYIFPALDKNPWSPIFIIDCDHLPIGYRNNPVAYIEKVVKKNALDYYKKMSKLINKIFPEMKLSKELIFDYEIIPFNPENISIHTRPDKTPSSFQNLLVTSIILNKDKNKFISAKIVQIQSILKYISPFSLIVSSVDTLLLEKFKSIEPPFLKELGKRKNGAINWEGIGNIINGNIKNLSDVLHVVATKELNIPYFTKAKCKEIITEIIRNANIINHEISNKN